MKKFVEPTELVGKTITAVDSGYNHLLMVCGEEFTYVRTQAIYDDIKLITENPIPELQGKFLSRQDHGEEWLVQFGLLTASEMRAMEEEAERRESVDREARERADFARLKAKYG